MSLIFARTRHHYDSYRDFWRLVQLSGFKTCWVDQIDLLDEWATYIFTPWNGEVIPLMGMPRKCQLIWWNLERPDGGPMPLEDVVDMAFGLVDRAWVSDRWYASLDPRFEFVPIGSHPELGNYDPAAEKKWDFAHLSYAWGRRAAKYARLRELGLSSAPECYLVADKDRELNASKLCLSLHQYDNRTTAPLRFALAAAYHLPLVSETAEDCAPFVEGTHLLQAHYDCIEEVVVGLLACPNDMKTLAENLHELLCRELTFRKCVEDAL